jgi:hypothetical protein
MTTRHELLTTSVEDPARFATSSILVRAGYAVGVDAGQSQFSPAWSPGANRIAYVEGGPPWVVVVQDFSQASRTVVATVDWTGSTYDGAVRWSRDGARIAFSEEIGGRRVIGLTNAIGTDRQTLDPDMNSQFFEAAFLPTDFADPESLVVSVKTATTSELRAYLAQGTEMGPGRLVYTPPAGRDVRWPDALLIGSDDWIGAVTEGAAASTVISFIDDGSNDPLRILADGSGKRTQLGWGDQGIVKWLNYVWDESQNFYRVNHLGSLGPMRLYTDLFPQQGGDLSVMTADQHVLSRQEPDGDYHLWVVEYPAWNVTPVPKAEELELESIGIRGALQPNAWRRWLGNRSWEEFRRVP